MTNKAKPMTGVIETPTLATKHQQIVDLLSREPGATLEEMSVLTNWQTHSTRAFLTGLKERGYEVASEKIVGVRHYQITKAPVA